MSESPELKGFFYPRTVGGTSGIIPSPPWYYSGDLLTVEYRTNPERVRELLPEPLEQRTTTNASLYCARTGSSSSSRDELHDCQSAQMSATAPAATAVVPSSSKRGRALAARSGPVVLVLMWSTWDLKPCLFAPRASPHSLRSWD